MTVEGPIPAALLADLPIQQSEESPVDIKTGETARKEPLSFDPAALKKKYLAERDKRLVYNKGVEQYTLLDGALSHYLRDPWIKPGFKRDPIEEEVEVVIVGGGYGAQLAAVRLTEAGVNSFRMIEKGGDFGGTWYWNRYPGAQCDIESYIYMPLLEETGYIPTEKYAHADELFKHAQRIGEKFDLYSRTLFQTETHEMRWNDEEAKWTTHTTRGDKIKSRFIIPAAGLLHRPKLPGAAGIEHFKGHSFHSSRWDFDYTGGDSSGNLHKLKDKRVGIIGSGATAVQIVPQLGAWAKQLYVFQRTPSTVDARNNKPTDPAWAKSLQKGWQKKRNANFDNLLNGGDEKEDLVADGWTEYFRNLGVDPSLPEDAAAKRQLADYKKMEFLRARVDTIVKDKETADVLKPWYNLWCKRPCFHDDYLDTFNRPSVKLVDTKGRGVERITENSIVVDDQEYEVDCLVYATGFELPNQFGWAHRTGIEIYGRNGMTTTEKWKDGHSTLHGWTTRHFPNCLLVSLLQSAFSPNFMYMITVQTQHFAYVISECIKRGIKTFEPTQEAEEEWCNIIEKGAADKSDFFSECTPSFYNNEGKPSKAAARSGWYPGGSTEFIKLLAAWRDANDLAGLDIVYNDKEDGRLPADQAINPQEGKH